MSNPARLANYIEKKLGFEVPLETTEGRDGYNQIVSFLCALDVTKRRDLFQKTQREVLGSSQANYAKHYTHLWWFSHPTFEVFDSFITNKALVDEFISYMYAVARCRGRKGNVKSKLRSEIHRGQILSRFLDPYLKLVLDTLVPNGRLTLKPKNRTTPANSLHLVCMSAPTPDEVKKAHVAYYFKWALVDARTGRYQPYKSLFLELASIVAPGNLDITSSVIEKKLHILYERLGVPAIKFVGHGLPHGVAPGLREHISQSLMSGRWVRFLSTTIQQIMEIPTRPFNQSVQEGPLPIIYEEVSQLVASWFATRHGLLPIGLKIHVLEKSKQVFPKLYTSSFTIEAATKTVVLPPVGNTDVAISLLDSIGRQIGESILDNEKYQIQVCSPGRLTPERAAYLGTAFYLGSDRLRYYNQQALKTSHPLSTGTRLVIYGAGVCDRNFGWRQAETNGGEETELPTSLECRTDILWCHSRRDLENVNLIATLLIHDQFAGYWKSLAETFMEKFHKIMDRHQLLGVLAAPWITTNYGGNESDDELFAQAFQELSAYAFSEAKRLQDGKNPKGSILQEVNDLLDFCHQKVRSK